MANIAFDIDDTLWKCRRKQMDQVPDYDLINILIWFYNNGDNVYVWSAGGMDYALQIVTKLGLDDMVTILDKDKKHDMDICFDDEQVNLAKINIHISRKHERTNSIQSNPQTSEKD
jgi:hypothetical protein